MSLRLFTVMSVQVHAGVLSASLGQGFTPISTAATIATTDKVWSVIKMEQIVNSQLCFLLCTPNIGGFL